MLQFADQKLLALRTLPPMKLSASYPIVAFLDYLTPVLRGNAWFTSIDLCVQITQFKIDTGAEVTNINTETYTKVWRISPSAIQIRKQFGPSKQSLKLALQIL